jgi:DNA-directed RNA polymerase subunit E'/Rpb7
MLNPNQMDNKMYLHVKTNLSNKLVGKCYKNYGHISKIYKIDEISDGIIEAEDPSCSIKLVVKFSCRLCYPIRNKEIIFKINRMNKALIGGVNGPLRVIITPDKINKDKFYADNNRNIRIRGSSDVIVVDMYIRVLILSSSFSDCDSNILVIGYLQDISTEEEKKIYIEQINE